jgi:hypothetical protein
MAVERFPIEAGQILQFARALGDANPIYHDESYAKGSELGGVIAPPTFTQASAHFDSEFPLRPRPGKPWFGSAAEDKGPGGAPGSEGGGIGLYAEHRFVYHRQLRPGDVLHTHGREGKTWEKEGRRGGRLRFREYITDFLDARGELVIESIVVGVTTEKTVGE